MADSIIRLKVDSQEYDNKLKRAAEGLTRYADQCRKAGGTLQYVDEGVLEFTRSLGKMDTVATTTRGKLAELTKTYTELSAQYRQMTDEEKKGEYGKALAANLEQLRGRIQSSKQELDAINQSINGGGGLTSSLDALAGKFGMSFKQLTGWGAALAAAKGALDVSKDAFFASEATVDEWGRVMDSSKSLYEGFLTALNTGDISGYLSRIDDIISAARAAYNELDRLGTMKTIQAPRISAQQTENERMRMMIQTGRYIAPVDGRRATMADGQKLSKDQIQRIEKQLQGGMQTMVQLVGNEVKQTGRAIDAVYRRQAAELGMSLKEFRAGTSSMAEFDKRIRGAENYRRYEREHTIYDDRTGIGHRDGTTNPFEQFAKWSTFRVDGQRYNDLVKLIQQRDQQASQAYSMQGQTYRTMNRAEGFTVRSIMNGGTGGSGGGNPVPVKIEGFDINAAAAAGVRGVDTMPSVFGMADRDAMRAAMGIAPQQWDAKQDISKSWHIGENGNLTQNPDDKRKEESRGKQDQEMAKLSQAISAIGSIKGGLEQMGIKLPAEAEAMIGGLQGLMSVVQGVGAIISLFSTSTETANTVAVTANTVALGTLTSAIMANTVADFIPFAHGGVVHAASGWVGGNQMSGDRVPAMLNSQELVLNRFQQEALAGTLQNNTMQRQAESQPYVTGSMIYLGLKNYLQQNGFGDIVTTKRK